MKNRKIDFTKATLWYVQPLMGTTSGLEWATLRIIHPDGKTSVLHRHDTEWTEYDTRYGTAAETHQRAARLDKAYGFPYPEFVGYV